MSNTTVAFETLLVLGLRLGLFLLASRYLKRALFADLRQVIHDETSLNTSGGSNGISGANGISLSGSGLNSGHESPDEFDTSMGSPIGNGQSLRDQLYNLRAGSISSSSVLPTSSSSTPSARHVSASMPERGTRKASSSTKKGNTAGAPKLAGSVFCLSVSECLTLFALILFGGAISEESRLLNWNFSLGAVLSIIVIVVPLGMCLLMTLRQRATSKSLRSTAMFTAVPFLLYLFCLYELGEYIATFFGVERGSRSFGLFSSTLDRICVPGVTLIAALSGGGAVITAWNAFEYRERFKAEAVTDGHINAAARSLAQTRTDLAARQAEVDALDSASHDDDSNKGFFSMFTSSPNAAKIKSLQAEIKGLEVMESQMSHDLQLMKRRKEIGELSKTWSGKALKALGWAFSVYCIYRVAMSLLNLIFGSALSSGGSGRSTPTDVTSAILSRVAEALGLDIDVHTWSKAVGLILTGSIILVNINAVLGYVSRAFRATSAGVSASFMLLFLSQLMAVYLLTSLISLPHPDATDGESSSPSAILLDTLPDFRVFSRLFDAVFLLAASTCFVLRYLQRKIRVDEHLGLQDFV